MAKAKLSKLTLPGGEAARKRLLAAVRRRLAFFREVDAFPELFEDAEVLRHAIRRYENCWLPLAAGQEGLAPPLDVDWVWYVHQLCPVEYDAEVGAAGGPHRAEFASDAELEAARDRTKALWMAQFPDEPFDFSVSPGPCTHKSKFAYDLAAASTRQADFSFQVSREWYEDEEFLENALDRYEKFLTIIKTHPKAFTSPTIDVDLVWHTHMSMSDQYKSDCLALLGRIVYHDDTDQNRAEGSKLAKAFRKSSQRWLDGFDEAQYAAGTGYIGKFVRVSTKDLHKALSAAEDGPSGITVPPLENVAPPVPAFEVPSEACITVRFSSEYIMDMVQSKWKLGIGKVVMDCMIMWTKESEGKKQVSETICQRLGPMSMERGNSPYVRSLRLSPRDLENCRGYLTIRLIVEYLGRLHSVTSFNVDFIGELKQRSSEFPEFIVPSDVPRRDEDVTGEPDTYNVALLTATPNLKRPDVRLSLGNLESGSGEKDREVTIVNHDGDAQAKLSISLSRSKTEGSFEVKSNGLVVLRGAVDKSSCKISPSGGSPAFGLSRDKAGMLSLDGNGKLSDGSVVRLVQGHAYAFSLPSDKLNDMSVARGDHTLVRFHPDAARGGEAIAVVTREGNVTVRHAAFSQYALFAIAIQQAYVMLLTKAELTAARKRIKKEIEEHRLECWNVRGHVLQTAADTSVEGTLLARCGAWVLNQAPTNALCGAAPSGGVLAGLRSSVRGAGKDLLPPLHADLWYDKTVSNACGGSMFVGGGGDGGGCGGGGE